MIVYRDGVGAGDVARVLEMECQQIEVIKFLPAVLNDRVLNIFSFNRLQFKEPERSLNGRRKSESPSLLLASESILASLSKINAPASIAIRALALPLTIL